MILSTSFHFATSKLVFHVPVLSIWLCSSLNIPFLILKYSLLTFVNLLNCLILE